MDNNLVIGIIVGGAAVALIRNSFTGIGAIRSNPNGAYQECLDGYFTTSNVPGRCSYHGGVFGQPLKRKSRRRSAAKVVSTAGGQMALFG